MGRRKESTQTHKHETGGGSQHSPTNELKAPHFAVQPRLTLEILKGETERARRAVERDLFFIGSDDDCDLPLIDESIPRVHSLIRSTPQGFWIEATASSSSVRLNGEKIQQGWVQDQDLLEIGPFQMRAVIGIKPQIDETIRLAFEPGEKVWSTGAKLIHEARELSTEQLLDRIVEEQEFVTSFEQGRKRGADALWRAIQARSRAMQVPAAPMKEELNPPRVAIRLQRPEEPISLAIPSNARPIALPQTSSEIAQLLERLDQAIIGLQDTTAPSPAPPTGVELQQEVLTRLEQMMHRLSKEPESDSDVLPLAIA